MYVVCVQVHIKPEHVEDFKRASKDNFTGTRTTEPGNLRWDLLQSEDDPTRFMIYEVYRTKEDFPIHQQTPHFKKYLAEAVPLLASRERHVWKRAAP